MIIHLIMHVMVHGHHFGHVRWVWGGVLPVIDHQR